MSMFFCVCAPACVCVCMDRMTDGFTPCGKTDCPSSDLVWDLCHCPSLSQPFNQKGLMSGLLILPAVIYSVMLKTGACLLRRPPKVI